MSIDTTFKVKNGVEVPDAEKLFTTDTPLTSKPSLNLIFNKTEYLDSRITFTRSGPATRTNSRGLIESVAADKARFDYDPITGVSKGLLIEEARTNLLTYSAQFNDASWTKNNVTITADATTAPDGALVADKLVETAANDVHDVRKVGVAASALTIYTQSIYLKSAERTKCELQMFGNAGGSTVSVDLSAVTATTVGAYGGWASASATISVVGNGWYRVTHTVTTNTGLPALTAFVCLRNAAGSASYTGDGTSGMFLWGAQLEAGAFATSYIPSTETFTSRASVGSYFDSTGTLQSASINTARYQYNTSNLSVAPFLLLEEARTNSIRNNTMVGAVSGVPGTTPTNWQTTGISGISYAVSGVGTENGINYIDIRVSGTSTVNSYASSTPDILIAAASGQTWTGSYWMKLVSGSFANTNANLEIREADASQVFLTNTLTPLSLTYVLTRYTQTRTLNNASTAFVSLRFVAQVSIGLAVDFTVRIGLPQLELGAYATSPILTSTAALTRSVDVSSSAASTRGADVARVNTITPWFNEAEGTLYGQAEVTNVQLANRAIIQIARSTSSAQAIYVNISRSADSRRQSGVAASTTQIAYAPTGTATNTKGAIAYKVNDGQGAFDGTVSTVTTTVTLPTALTTMYIGNSDGVNTSLNGWIKRVSYFPRRLSSTELVALTT